MGLGWWWRCWSDSTAGRANALHAADLVQSLASHRGPPCPLGVISELRARSNSSTLLGVSQNQKQTKMGLSLLRASQGTDVAARMQEKGWLS